MSIAASFPRAYASEVTVVILLLVAALIFAVIGALTVAKWLLIIAGVLCVVAVVSAVLNRSNNRTLP